MGSKSMAATAFPDASRAAVGILQAGGNAIDAAVAAAWALAVCEPSGSGLGGQATLLFYPSSGRAVVIDGHSYAPRAVSKQVLTRAQQKKGYGATTIPSMPATLGFAQ
ncbi:MAG: gamma-glutamyltransferase, partial [Planctomycetota bacterium]